MNYGTFLGCHQSLFCLKVREEGRKTSQCASVTASVTFKKLQSASRADVGRRAKRDFVDRITLSPECRASEMLYENSVVPVFACLPMPALLAIHGFTFSSSHARFRAHDYESLGFRKSGCQAT